MKHILLLLCLFSLNCFGSECVDFYPNKRLIEIKTTVEVCKSFFVVVVDSVNHRPLFSSEYHIPSDNHIKRASGFYNNSNYTLRDEHYPIGYDRGHLTPAANAATLNQMYDTFDIINTAPQIPKFNRGSWKKFEEQVRNDYTFPVWIVTGVIYGNDPLVPEYFYKIVFRGSGKWPVAYIAKNAIDGTPTAIRLSDLSKKTKIKFK